MVLTSIAFKFHIAGITWIVIAFVLQFFCGPHRAIPQDDGIIESRADDKVICTGVVDDPCLDRKAFKISGFMNVLSVHSNRAPMADKVKTVWWCVELCVTASFALGRAWIYSCPKRLLG